MMIVSRGDNPFEAEARSGGAETVFGLGLLGAKFRCWVLEKLRIGQLVRMGQRPKGRAVGGVVALGFT
jgi:hypothetical protein